MRERSWDCLEHVIAGARYSAPLRVLDRLLQRIGTLRKFETLVADYGGGFVEEFDQSDLDIFRSNIRNVIGLARVNGVIPVFGPQVLDYESVAGKSELRMDA